MKTKTIQNNYQRILLIFLVLLTAFSCSKDDDSNQENATSDFPQIYFDVPEADFRNEELPTSNSELLTIEAVQGNSIILAGGSNSLAITATGEPTKLIVGVEGVKGFYHAPYGDLGGRGVSIEELVASINLLIGQDATSSFTIAIAVGDEQGNLSDYYYLPVNLMEAGTGLLQISCSWNQPNDVDLHLIEPDGDHIYFGNSNSDNGGQLDVDSNAACNLDNINNENIYYEDNSSVTIEEGEYEVLVDLWSNCNVEGNTEYIVTAYYDGVLIATTEGSNPNNGSFVPTDDANASTSVMKFTIGNTAPRNATEATTTTHFKAYKFHFKNAGNTTVLSPEKM